MSSSDGTDADTRTLSAARTLPLPFVVLALLIPVLMMNKLNQQPIRSPNAQITKWLIISVLVSNTLNHSVFIIKLVLCESCHLLFGLTYGSRAIVRGLNLLFLLHRAKLSQGINPILSKKWFEKVFPSIIVVGIIGFLFLIFNALRFQQFVCVPYDDWLWASECLPPTSDRDSSGTITIILAIGVDGLVTTILLAMFIVPLYHVFSVDLGVMNNNQLSQRKKLKKLLIWSITLTLINQVTTTLVIAPALDPDNYPDILWFIGQCDPAINVWTSWLMITRNRQYLARVYSRSWCRNRTKGKREALPSGLTNVPSRADSLMRSKSSIEMISVDVQDGELIPQHLEATLNS